MDKDSKLLTEAYKTKVVKEEDKSVLRRPLYGPDVEKHENERYAAIQKSLNKADKEKSTEAMKIFSGETIQYAKYEKGSISLYTSSGHEIHIFPGSRGVTDWDNDSIAFWKK